MGHDTLVDVLFPMLLHAKAIKCNMNVGAFFKGNVTGIVLILVALVAHETKPWLQLEEDWFQSER